MSEPDCIVFVVDDDPLVRASVADLLEAAGFAVRTYGSATEFVQSQRPDVSACLILDVELPGLSGLDLQAELANSGVDMPIIFLTGHGDIPMSVRAMKRGAVEFLTKPFQKPELLAAVQEGLRRDGEGRSQRSESRGAQEAPSNPNSTRASSPGAGGYRPLKQAGRRRAWDHRGDDQSAPRPRDAKDGRRLAGRSGTHGREAQNLGLAGHSTKVE